jgi:hypothetical protein
MRFRDRKPAPFLARKDRSRIVRLSVAFVMIVLAIKVAADPATWVWMFPRDPAKGHAAASLDDVRYDVSLEDEPLRADEFRSDTNSSSAASNATDDVGLLFSNVTLADVEDDTLSLRKADRVAYHAVLDRLRAADERDIESAADPSGTFPAVMTEPAHFRGRVVSIRGTARRILEIPATSANSQEAGRLYELWVFTPDSGDNPWRVVATDIPKGLPRGLLEDGVPVRIAGVFFKRQGYETQAHALHVAPLLLAKTVHRVRPAGRRLAEFDPTPWLIGAGIAVAVVLALAFIRFRREDRAFEKTTLARFTAATPDEVAAIPDAETDNPAIFFQKLESAEHSHQEPENTLPQGPHG